VRIDAVELRRVTLPLVSPFVTAHGTERDRHLVLVRVLGEHEGWGECAALSAPTYTEEWAGGAAAVLRDHLVPLLLARRSLDAVAGHPMAKAALEMALLDASLRDAGRSLAEHLGATRTCVPSGIALGLDATGDDVDAAVAAGYRRVKLKVEPGREAVVRSVRAAHPELPLQVDANGAYAGHDDAAASLAALDDLGLLLIEQPLAADDLLGHAALARTLRTPLCLDESITSVRSLDVALAVGACRAVNLKPGRVGGFAAARAVHDRCVTAGVDLWCGGMLESGLGRAANVALAALPGFTLPGDLSPSSRWYHEDLTEPVEMVDGELEVPTSPGIGRTPLDDVLRRRTTSVELVRP
jgi:O-succinylbenzoate synthase